MNRFTILFLFSICLLKVRSQNFDPLSYLGNGSQPYYVERVLNDSVHGQLLVSSKWIKYAGGKKVRGICSWNGIKWDSLAGGINTHDNINSFPNGNILCSIAFNGKLLVGGNFESIGGIKASGLATWDGSKWDSLPKRAFKFLDYGASIYSFAVYNNKLYIGGYFDSIQGQPANGLATYDGTSFQPVACPLSSQAGILDMKVYKGNLYIGGVFTNSNQAGDENILKYDGSNWSSLNGGIKGSTSSLASMEEYDNNLYVAGYFTSVDGNIANVVMKWDGSNWQNANWGNEYQNGSVWKLIKYHNRLYAFGTFMEAGNKQCDRVAVSDGLSWCTFSDSLDGNIFTATVFRDSIYIGGAFKSINGDTSMRCVAKFATPFNYENCVLANSVFKHSLLRKINYFPNPTKAKIHFQYSNEYSDVLRVNLFDIHGQLVLSEEISSRRNVFDLSSVPLGMYFMKISDSNSEIIVKILKE